MLKLLEEHAAKGDARGLAVVVGGSCAKEESHFLFIAPRVNNNLAKFSEAIVLGRGGGRRNVAEVVKGAMRRRPDQQVVNQVENEVREKHGGGQACDEADLKEAVAIMRRRGKRRREQA